MSNNGWMTKHSLGSLESTTDEINYLNEPKEECKNSLSQEKNSLLEDYRSGIITTEELQLALKELKSKEKI